MFDVEESHLSDSCQKPSDQLMKCALCSGIHTANYRGYPIYKEIQSSRFPVKSHIIFNSQSNPNHNVQSINVNSTSLPNPI